MKGRGKLYAVLKDASVITAKNEGELSKLVDQKKVLAIFKGQRLGFVIEKKPSLRLLEYIENED